MNDRSHGPEADRCGMCSRPLELQVWPGSITLGSYACCLECWACYAYYHPGGAMKQFAEDCTLYSNKPVGEIPIQGAL